MALEFGVLPLLAYAGGLLDDSNVMFTQTLVVSLVTVIWLVPVVVLSLGLNAVWLDEIAKLVFNALDEGKRRSAQAPKDRGRDELYRMLLFMFLSLQSFLTLNCLPFKPAAYVVEFVQSSFTFAFYCFDYSWALAGFSLEERLSMFESHWPFMLGFGMPLAAVTLYLRFFWGYVVYALVFPVLMILAIVTKPTTHKRGWKRVKVFRASQYMTLWAIRLMCQGVARKPNPTKHQSVIFAPSKDE